MRIGINTALLLAVTSSVTAGVVSLILYSTLSTLQISSEIQSEALMGSAKFTQEFLGFYIQQSREVVRDIAALPAIKEALTTDPERAKALLHTFVAQSDMFATLMLLDTSGKPVSGEAKSGEPLAPSYADREYFQAIVGGQDSAVTRRILRGKTSKILMFVVSQAVRGPDGKLLGVVVGCPAWEPFTKRFVDPIKFGASGYAFLIDDEGLVIAHGADKSLILNRDIDRTLSKKILEVKNGILRYTFNNQDKYLAVSTLPETGWVVCMNATAAEMNAGAMRQRTILIAVGIAVLVVVVAVISIFNRIVVLSPLAAIGEFTRKVAAGDLKASLAGRFRFELAPLAGNLRHMVDELKAKLGFAEGVLQGIPAPCAILTPDRKLSWLNRRACASLEKKEAPETYRGQSAGAFFFDDPDRTTLSDKALLEKHPITAKVDYRVPSGAEHHYDFAATPFFDMDGNLLGSFTFWTDLTEIVTQQKRIEEQNTIIAHTAAEAAVVSDRMASAAQQLSAQIEQSTNGVDLQHQRIQDTATAIEEMNATILEVAKNAGNTAQSAENAKGKASEGEHLVAEVVRSVLAVRDEAEGLKATMHGLGEQAQGIGAVLGVISDIADQTNLLALNAAIEAARAGEAGRGFAVVADEVRKLAEKTMSATSEVGQAIRGIQQGTHDTVSRVEGAVGSVAQAASLAERSGGTLKEIVALVVAAGDQVRSIATAAEQQSATSEEINRSVEEVNRLSTETADAMAQSNQAVAELSELAQRLNSLIRRLEGGGGSPMPLASSSLRS